MEGHALELRFSANSLANKDVLSLSDPFLVIHTYRDGRPHRYVGRTEVVTDDLDTYWVTSLIFFDINDLGAFIVHVFDEDSTDTDVLHKHDFLSMAIFSLPDLRNDRDMNFTVPFHCSEAYLYHNRILCSDEKLKPSSDIEASSSLHANQDSVDSQNTNILSARSNVTSLDTQGSILKVHEHPKIE